MGCGDLKNIKENDGTLVKQLVKVSDKISYFLERLNLKMLFNLPVFFFKLKMTGVHSHSSSSRFSFCM